MAPYGAERKCIQFEKVKNASLICLECKEWADKNGKFPKNILLCTIPKHERISNEDIATRLESYLKGFTPNILRGKDIIQASHVLLAKDSYAFNGHKGDICKCKTLSRANFLQMARTSHNPGFRNVQKSSDNQHSMRNFLIRRSYHGDSITRKLGHAHIGNDYCKKSTYGKQRLQKLTHGVRSPRERCLCSVT